MRFLALLLVALVGCAAAAPQVYIPSGAVLPEPPVARTIHYPRRYLPLQLNGAGEPCIKAGILDSAFCDTVSKYDIVIANAAVLKARPDLPAYLKHKNPGMILLAYLAGSVWENPHPAIGDTNTDLAWARWRVVRDHNAFLWGTNGSYLDAWANRDFADHRMALDLAAVDATALVPGVDGLFLDSFMVSVLWEQSAADSVDYVRAGFACLTDWDHAYREGHRIYVERLRGLVGGSLIVGNGGPSGERDVLNGWMREGFPDQNGGTWESNMVAYGSDPGYLGDGYVKPTLNLLVSTASAYPEWDRQRFLFGLASATLGEGAFALVGDASPGGPNPANVIQWPPEYDMDLGVPYGPARKLGSGIWFRAFSHGAVFVDPVAQTGRIEQK